ncbi:MAG: DUF3299 domain-containing protein [Rhizobiaceae bacterium]
MFRVLFTTASTAAIALAAWAIAATSLEAMPTAKRIGFDELRSIYASAGEAGTTPFASETSIELAGYMLPADQEGGLVYEFLLFARPGACSHTAAPPPDQVVRIIPDQPFEAGRMYQSVRVTGTLLSEHNKAQLYVLDGVRVVESAFRISSATVEGIEIAPSTQPRGGKSPWGFLTD